MRPSILSERAALGHAALTQRLAALDATLQWLDDDPPAEDTETAEIMIRATVENERQVLLAQLRDLADGVVY